MSLNITGPQGFGGHPVRVPHVIHPRLPCGPHRLELILHSNSVPPSLLSRSSPTALLILLLLILLLPLLILLLLILLLLILLLPLLIL
jgi:hypothetical protein